MYGLSTTSNILVSVWGLIWFSLMVADRGSCHSLRVLLNHQRTKLRPFQTRVSISGYLLIFTVCGYTIGPHRFRGSWGYICCASYYHNGGVNLFPCCISFVCTFLMVVLSYSASYAESISRKLGIDSALTAQYVRCAAVGCIMTINTVQSVRCAMVGCIMAIGAVHSVMYFNGRMHYGHWYCAVCEMCNGRMHHDIDTV